MAAETLLDLPAGHVGIDYGGIVGSDECGAGADNQRIRAGLCKLLPCRLKLVLVEEVADSEVGHVAVQDVVRHEWLRHAADLPFGLHQSAGLDDCRESGR